MRRLKVLESTSVSVDFQEQWHTVLVPSNPGDISDIACALEPGDLVIVSSDDGRHIGLTLGTILSLSRPHSVICLEEETTGLPHEPSPESQHNRLLLSTERPLPSWIQLFRLDRYASPKVTQLNLSNLVGLMQPSVLCNWLRSLIIDAMQPTSKSTLSKSLVADIRRLLKHLNSSQRTAILRVLMANHYVLIKGYPGTGKTETLVSLLRVFVHMKKKVLVVAHTHSAVDNLLLRLRKSCENGVLRLGSPDRVHKQLLDCCLEKMLTHHVGGVDPTDFVRSTLDNAAVVGCTALAASGGLSLRHAALSHTCFDLVLIDEASQLLLPTALGALSCLRTVDDQDSKISKTDPGRFVLVGDPYQLPPLVRSSQARRGGLDRSLFHHLLDASLLSPADSCVRSSGHIVELNLQYRMNAPILHMVNELSYSNRIQPVSSAIANSTLLDVLKIPAEALFPNIPQALPSWLRRSLSSSLSDSVICINTMQSQICQLHSIERKKYNNETEAKLVSLLCKSLVQQGLPPSDTGVIAPYRNQVALVKQLLLKCSEPLAQIEVATVDQFQGRDKRAIILSLTACTEINPDSTMGHLLDDLARLTVAITRAKHKLIIIGCCHDDFEANTSRHIAKPNVLSRLFHFAYEADAYETFSPADLSFL